MATKRKSDSVSFSPLISLLLPFYLLFDILQKYWVGLSWSQLKKSYEKSLICHWMSVHCAPPFLVRREPKAPTLPSKDFYLSLFPEMAPQ